MKVPTGCASVDKMLEGGLEPGAITLVYGVPASGKTNLCLQVSKQIVAQGLKVAYVDTEGVSFDRLRQIAGDRYKDMMSGVLFSAPRGFKDQERLVRQATQIPDAGLIVVDSLNYYYRLELDEDPQAASRSLVGQLGALQTACRASRTPVLVTAQVYGSDEEVLPFGGKSMGHIVKTVLEFQRPEETELAAAGARRAVLRKHRAIPEGREAKFRIVDEGLQ